MDKYLSIKLSRLSCILILIVVLLHSTIGGGINSMMWTINSAIGPVNTILESFIQRGACAIAVPLFFAVSGYLFYRNVPIRTTGGVFLTKYKSRIKTLAVPYLIWVVLFVLVHLIVCHIGLRKGCLLCNNIWDSFSTVPFKRIVLCLITPTPAWHLWFIRDLIILVILSPFIFLSLKYLRWGTIVLTFISFVYIWVKDLNILDFFNLGRSFVSPLFFMIGGYIALFHQKVALMRWSNKTVSIFMAILWVLLLSLQTIFLVKGYCEGASFFHQVSVFAGIAFLWTFYDTYLSKTSLMNVLDKIVPYTFFIYLCHFLVLQPYFRYLWYALFGKSSVSYIVSSFVLAIITSLTCLLIAKCIKKNAPSFYQMLVGGRI